ncbi:SapC family protein [Alteromonas sp. ASW11-130]|uniref:SapC family protein n=1 Tax=Alteromonas sp. ASW11-130 TaxID=3015775 RepID=UPI002242A0BB|nr:SapC family protein [Alteromonas sp. ASW11-130]MCW8092960.1 SapC family protein [Alteromonas sp. ASW11-130]
MSTVERLNNVSHKDLKINTARSAELGDNVMFSLTFPREFRSAQAYYPIVFHKDADSGQFYPVILFGFQQQENLFLNDEGWDADYVPINVSRQPFSIGLQDGQRVVNIDTDSPRVNADKGEALFLEFGGNAPYLEKVSGMLEALHHGVEENKAFVDCLLHLKLIESFTLDVTLNNGSQHQLIGFYTINEDTLDALSDEEWAELRKSGFLTPIYMMLASQSQFSALVNRKNKRLNIAE